MDVVFSAPLSITSVDGNETGFWNLEKRTKRRTNLLTSRKDRKQKRRVEDWVQEG